MDLKDSIKEAMYDLPDTEKLIVLSVMIDTLMDSMEEMKKEIRFIRSIIPEFRDMVDDTVFDQRYYGYERMERDNSPEAVQ